MNLQTTGAYRALEPALKAFFDRQHLDAYRLLDAARHPQTGLYADAYAAFKPNPLPMCSIAATGVGLIGLAVADAEGWDPDAAAKAVVTLETATGRREGCTLAKDAGTGFVSHFVEVHTGARWGNSEFSTIDTALLAAGARFVAAHFGPAQPQIAKLADELLHSVDWTAVVADAERGAINMVVAGGVGDKPTQAFNEYALVAHLARRAQPKSDPIQALWQHTYAVERIERLARLEYRGVPVLSGPPGPGRFLSSFVPQFPFYLVPDYTESERYRELLANAALADCLAWREHDVPGYIWGYGAGPNNGLQGGYHADAIGRPSGDVASAYIVAGFLPVYPAGLDDLFALYSMELPYDRYVNPLDPEDQRRLRAAYRFGLHRFSWSHRRLPERWYPETVTLIDWSSMLYGLAAFKRGPAFFSERTKAA